MSWASAFTDELLALKHRGFEFDNAYEMAATLWPISPRELGGFPQRLTDPNPEDWWREVCRSAWTDAPASDGRRSRLYLLPGLVGMIGGSDESSAARRVSRRARA